MGRKLLVADDSVTIQKVIKLALSSEGYDILTVSEGKDAIRAIQEEKPDAVLIDVTLPGADAYTVKRAINAIPALASVGFILMLSAFERVDEDAIASVGFQGRLIKPFDPSHLRKAVAEVMGGKGTASPAAPKTPAQQAPKVPSFAPPPPPPSVMPETPGSISNIDDDLPPIRDMHPTLPEETAATVTEEDFLASTPAPESTVSDEPGVGDTAIDLAALTPARVFTLPSPDAATFDTTSEPAIVPPAKPPSVPVEEHTDPNFTIPDEAVARSIENDIKDLTESTIKMSGLDEWSLEDGGKMKEPPPKAVAPPPAPPAAPPAEAKKPVEKPFSGVILPPEFEDPPKAAAPPVAPKITPPPEKTREMTMPSIDKKAAILRGLMSPPTHSIDDGDSTFPLSTLKPGAQQPVKPAATKAELAARLAASVSPGPAKPPAADAPESTPEHTISIVGEVGLGRDYVGPSTPPTSIAPPKPTIKEPKVEAFTGVIPPPATSGPTRAEIEEIIRKEVAAAIAKLARESFPQIVEQVIRQEIEKLLAE